MALRKGLVEPVYGLVLRQSVVERDGAVVVQRPDGTVDSGCVTVGHDGLCFDDAEIVFSRSKAYVARCAFIRAGKLAGMRYPGFRQRAFAGAGRTGGVETSSTRTSSRVNRLAEREAPRIPGVGRAPVVLMSAAVLPMSVDCVKLRLRSCCNTVLCPGAEFPQIHRFDGATPHQLAAQSPVAPLRFVEMLQRMVLPSGVALPCTWDSEDAFRFLVMLQKSSLIDRVLGFAGGHIRFSRFRFFLCPPPLMPAGSYA